MATNQGSANIISNPSETLQGHLYACTITTWAFAATAVAVRFYTRVKIVGNTGWDDWMIVLALVCSSVYATFQMLQTYYGMGRHFGDILPEHWTLVLMYRTLSQLANWCTVTCTKMSILILFRRILQHGRQKVLIHIMMGVVMVHFLYTIIQLLVWARPFTSYWRISPNTVFGSPWALLVPLPLHLLTDILILALPISTIIHLQARRVQKIMLLGIFLSGFIICVLTALRLYALLANVYKGGRDTSYEYLAPWYWSDIEIQGGIFVSCLMTLKPFLNKVGPGLWTVYSNSAFSRRTGTASRAADAQDRTKTVNTFSGSGSQPRRDPWGKLDDDAESEVVLVQAGPEHNAFEMDDYHRKTSSRAELKE